MSTLREQYPVRVLFSSFSVSRSTYYYQKNKTKMAKQTAREVLQSKVVVIHEHSRGSAGSRSITAALRNQGHTIGRYKVRALMREKHICGKQRRKRHHGQLNHVQDIQAFNHLDQNFSVHQPNQVWCGDITYIRTDHGWLYYTVVIDLYKRRLVGWAYAQKANTKLVLSALCMAYKSRNRPNGVLFHSDQGSQYTSLESRERLDAYRMKQSLSRKGNCWDNAPVERFFGSYKSEWMPKQNYKSPAEAIQDIASYIRYYNHRRPHSANLYLPPAVAEKQAAMGMVTNEAKLVS